jgi:hypothetical protein
MLHDGRSITLPGVIHIPSFTINMVFFIKMSDATLYFIRIGAK